MTKTIKRNELAIFEELRLKQPTNARTPEHYPKEYSLRKLNILSTSASFANTNVRINTDNDTYVKLFANIFL